MPNEEALRVTESDVVDHKLIVYFSDGTVTVFTVEELVRLHPERERAAKALPGE